MPYLPKGVAQPIELMKRLKDLGSLFPPEVVNWRYTLENDWSGDPAIFFWITISDDVARPPNLSSITHQIKKVINGHLDPLHEWGMMAYLNFRSQSEQEELKEAVFG
jgi:hypothetical protein